MTITVKVKLFATFREVAGGRREADVELPEKATVMDLIEGLSQLFGYEIKDNLLDFETGDLKPLNKVLINGCNAELLQKLKTPLKEGDVVALFPPVGGG
ncbi:MAG: ThiS family protein [Candidatus Bathyarchaeota archaeon BA1]|nr:MAG: ThiS family protein [Candidatus Bathyarchaeota archaeon BA1]